MARGMKSVKIQMTAKEPGYGHHPFGYCGITAVNNKLSIECSAVNLIDKKGQYILVIVQGGPMLWKQAGALNHSAGGWSLKTELDVKDVGFGLNSGIGALIAHVYGMSIGFPMGGGITGIDKLKAKIRLRGLTTGQAAVMRDASASISRAARQPLTASPDTAAPDAPAPPLDIIKADTAQSPGVLNDDAANIGDDPPQLMDSALEESIYEIDRNEQIDEQTPLSSPPPPCDPFDGRWDAEWTRVDYPGAGHYITGAIRQDGKITALATGVPGRRAGSPPLYLQGFSLYAPTREGGGYWLMFRHPETAKQIFVE
ncbi:MAG: hypothetical protein ACOYJD_05195 [Christensenellales bacterium]|jgi:hypothetical protein